MIFRKRRFRVLPKAACNYLATLAKNAVLSETYVYIVKSLSPKVKVVIYEAINIQSLIHFNLHQTSENFYITTKADP
jgi:hypothetical protein